MRTKETNEQRLTRLEESLALLPESVIEEITTAFECTDPLSFAKYLHTWRGLDELHFGAAKRVLYINTATLHVKIRKRTTSGPGRIEFGKQSVKS